VGAKRLNEPALLTTNPALEPQVKKGEQSVHPFSSAGILDADVLRLIELPMQSLSVQQGFADNNRI